MNSIREIQRLNKRELEQGIPPSASWHVDYRDTAYINIGGLPFDLTEGDIITIFSQFGEPTFVKLARDKVTGKSRGFAWLKYEDQRSCDLAVDNLGGATVLDRMLRVDHARYRKADNDDEDEAENAAAAPGIAGKGVGGASPASAEERPTRPVLKEELELQKLIAEHDDEDPMKGYLVSEKKAEVEKALERYRRKEEKYERRERRHRHRGDSRERRRREHSPQDRDHSHHRPRQHRTKRSVSVESYEQERERRRRDPDRTPIYTPGSKDGRRKHSRRSRSRSPR